MRMLVDGIPVEARPGEKVLWAALRAGIYIPNLCALEDSLPLAGCRLCLVEVAGEEDVAAACALAATPGLEVSTHSPRLERLRRTALGLILASHEADCPHCPRHRRCDLQKVAAHLRMPLRPTPFPPLFPTPANGFPHPHFAFLSQRCILCGKCVWVCRERVGKGMLDFMYRGVETVIGASAPDEDYAFCPTCRQCVEVCPTAALLPRGEA